MPATDPRQAAKRRLGYVTPRNVAKVLAHDRYWAPHFLDELFTKADRLRFEDPDIAFRFAAVLPSLVDRIPWERLDNPHFEGPWRVRALALHMETADLVGEEDLAAVLSSRATAIHPVPAAVTAELCRRQGAVHLRRGRHSQARLKIDQALRIYRRLEHHQGTAETLFFDVAAGGSPVGLAEIPTHLPPLRTASPLLSGALWGLLARIQGPDLEINALEAVLGWLDHARKHHRAYNRRPSELPRALMSWVEGLVHDRLGVERLARLRLNRARLILVRRREDAALAVCTLDQVAVLRGLGSLDEAQDLIEDTCKQIPQGLQAAIKNATSLGWLELKERRRTLATTVLPDIGTIYPLTSREPGDFQCNNSFLS